MNKKAFELNNTTITLIAIIILILLGISIFGSQALAFKDLMGWLFFLLSKLAIFINRRAESPKFDNFTAKFYKTFINYVIADKYIIGAPYSHIRKP